MKVLYITHCVNMGGGNFSLLQLMKELSNPPYNIEPILLAPIDSPDNTSSILKEARALGLKCISARFYKFKWEHRSFPNYLRYASNLINYNRILRIVQKEKPDIIHTNSSIIDIGAFLSKKLHIKHVWHLREFGDWDFNLKPLFGISQEKKLYNNASVFIAISKSVKKRFLPFIKPESKILVVYNGLPINLNKLTFNENVDTNIINFCISGSLNHAKRQIDALQALNKLINERRVSNVHLYILGEGGDRAILERFCKENNLMPYVTFTGWIKNVDDYYTKSHVGLMLSTNEGFGRVTIDYMRSGLAVIASDGGANPEIVTNNETGLLFPTGDVNTLCNLMAQMVNDPVLRKKLSKNAYDFSLNNFKSADNTQAIFNIYIDLIKSRK